MRRASIQRVLLGLVLCLMTVIGLGCGAQLGETDLARDAAREFHRLSAQVPLCPSDAANGDWRTFWRLAYPYLKEPAFEQVLEGIGKADLPV